MLRVKELQNELTQARSEIQVRQNDNYYDNNDNADIIYMYVCVDKYLMAENRIFKIMEKRQDTALSKYEDTHSQLPQVIKSYSEDLRKLQNHLRRMKTAYRQLEENHQLQNTELSVIQKAHKHLLDLTKNKQLGEREKLSNQLEEAENTIKKLEKKNQVKLLS